MKNAQRTFLIESILFCLEQLQDADIPKTERKRLMITMIRQCKDLMDLGDNVPAAVSSYVFDILYNYQAEVSGSDPSLLSKMLNLSGTESIESVPQMRLLAHYFREGFYDALNSNEPLKAPEDSIEERAMKHRKEKQLKGQLLGDGPAFKLEGMYAAALRGEGPIKQVDIAKVWECYFCTSRSLADKTFYNCKLKDYLNPPEDNSVANPNDHSNEEPDSNT